MGPARQELFEGKWSGGVRGVSFTQTILIGPIDFSPDQIYYVDLRLILNCKDQLDREDFVEDLGR